MICTEFNQSKELGKTTLCIRLRMLPVFGKGSHGLTL